MKKCPRCELNYIRDDENLCKVCYREIKGSPKKDELELCSICGAAPALPGKDICLSCYHEMDNHPSSDKEHSSTINDEMELDNASAMDEIISDVKEDLDDVDFDEDSELSLESIMQDEADDETEDEEYD